MKEKNMQQSKSRIISNKKVKGEYFCCTLQSPRIASTAIPGQFIMVRTAPGSDPLLRRPLGIHRAEKGTIALLYEVVGTGTRLLSRKKPGEYLDITGPLGNGFDCQPLRRPIVLAGGMGVAPLAFLARSLANKRPQKKSVQGIALIGARSAKGILCEKEFNDAGFDVTIATDDGSRGFKGYITALLRQKLSAIDYRLSIVYACGPRLMLAEAARLCRANGIPAQVSLEEHMACGIGACLGCVVRTRSGFKRVCKEGPVFDAADLVWERKGE